jgi:L-threonylcarbamoyladenylate synthase
MTSAWHLRRARDTVRAGGVIAYPTEAVWGLGCDPLDVEALDRILELKGRDPCQGFILIAASREQLAPYLGRIAPEIESRIGPTWPGPVTWILPAAADLPPELTGGRTTIAARVSAHPVVRALCEMAGMPLVSTSANRSGHPPARTLRALRATFADEIDYAVPGTVGALARPTETRDGATGKVLRPA